eukprot:GHVP01006323.1.p1 GENE.GHVP01006323.1~~GHVP01006323.1.p1  ORF type:complete len:180 (-),score=31.67 GHVP01006323.1:177-692(-)
MEFFKNVSDELANAFVGHHPNVENECQQLHALSFRTDGHTESQTESQTLDDYLQESWPSSDVPLLTPEVVVTVENWAFQPPSKIILTNDGLGLLTQALINRRTENHDLKANMHCEIKDGKIILSWETSDNEEMVNPLPVGDNKRYFWYMSQDQAMPEEGQFFNMLMCLQSN